MSTTAQQAFDLAVERSSLNDSSLIPTTQAIRYISNFEKIPYLRASKLNPEFFATTGDSATRTAYADSWNLSSTPGGIASVLSVVVKTITGTVTGVTVGDEVTLIDYRWPNVGLSPRAYIEGKKLFAYDDELGSADANMVTQVTVRYTQLPAGPTAMAQNLSIPDEWIDLVVLPLAKLMALRDSRPGEIELLNQELAMVSAAFDEHVMLYDGGAGRPVQSTPLRTALDGAQ